LKAIINVRIYDFNQYIDHGYIVFDKTIREVGNMTAFNHTDMEIIDGNNQLLLPGFVNGHSHIYSFFARGMNVEFNPHSFQELLEQLWWKLDRHLTNEMTYYSALLSGQNYLSSGVTTIIDHHASGEIIGSLDALNKGLEKVGLRKIVCFETSDRFSIEDCITENQTWAQMQTEKTRGLLGMHASFTLSDKTLKQLKEAFPSTPIHIHVAESIDDQEHCLNHHHMRVIERLDRYGLVRPHSIIAHAIHVSDNELDILAKNQAVVALNVTSNMNNAVGLPSYRRFKDKGIPIIIGNDGIQQQITSEYLALYFAMHHQSQSPIGFGYDDLKDVINNTYDYASMMLGVKLGKFETGFVSDFMLIDYPTPTPINQDNIFGHLLFGLFPQCKPTDVYIDGIPVYRDKTVPKYIGDAYEKAQELAATLWDAIEKEGK